MGGGKGDCRGLAAVLMPAMLQVQSACRLLVLLLLLLLLLLPIYLLLT